MAVIDKKLFECPSCGLPIELTVYKSINAASDAKMRDRVVTTEIFDQLCPECGAKFKVAYDMLYHEPDRGYMIYLLPNGDEGNDVFDMGDEVDTDVINGYALRIVNNINSLKEKILIFEDGLDDRVVEFCKVYFTINYTKEHPDTEIKEVFYTAFDGDNDAMEFCFFDGEGNPFGVRLPVYVYKNLFEDFKKSSAFDTNERYINSAWAIKALDNGVIGN